MKLLVIGIDALMPELVFENPELCPNITELIQTGVSGAYSGYIYGHGSRDNWISMYTGLEPEEHGTILNKYKNTNRIPRSTDYSDENTLWNILSLNGVKVGFWKGLSTTPPQTVNGYIIAGEPHYEHEGYDSEIVNRKPIVSKDNEFLLNFIKGEEPIHPEPKTLRDFGYTFEELKNNPNKIDEILKDDYFEESLIFLKQNLQFRLENMLSVQRQRPVDLMWVYDAVFDYIAHFQMFDTQKKVLKKALMIIDWFVGELVNGLQPENVFLLSDHGQKSYREIFPNTPVEVVNEAFGLADQSIITDKNIVLIGRMEGLLTGLHSLNGVIIFSGKDINQNGFIENMRTIDIYPTILELFNCKVPDDRKGFVQNIFSESHKIVNKDKLYSHKEKTKILLLQNEEVSEFNRAINEFYKKNRFSEIYVLGEVKYREIFKANDQVTGFISMEEVYKKQFDQIFAVYHNRKTKEIKFIDVILNM